MYNKQHDDETTACAIFDKSIYILHMLPPTINYPRDHFIFFTYMYAFPNYYCHDHVLYLRSIIYIYIYIFGQK